MTYAVTILRRAQKELGALAGEAYTRPSPLASCGQPGRVALYASRHMSYNTVRSLVAMDDRLARGLQRCLARPAR